ncbi:ComF family protein [Alkalinema sp. FACHB-956]|uniref:ComF family protein n=1 Tax=Alkalinema sp. FACHB-956 TaxID=2692768 RepID=UPI0018EFC21F|nr:ComF family protein [Alkalinema sp. FACHB-956]
MQISSFLNLFLQNTCGLCDRAATDCLCPACQHQVLLDRGQGAVAEHPATADRVFAWGRYDRSVKRAIAQLKYGHQPQIGDWFGQQLAAAWIDRGLSKASPRLIAVPIPLAADRRKQRGYNQAEQIARSFCQRVGYPLQPQGLLRVRETQAQYQLSGRDRIDNLAQAFRLNPQWQQSPPRDPVVLIDDIYTTGATIQAATAVLRRSGIRVWGCAVVARAGASLGSPPSS